MCFNAFIIRVKSLNYFLYRKMIILRSCFNYISMFNSNCLFLYKQNLMHNNVENIGYKIKLTT